MKLSIVLSTQKTSFSALTFKGEIADNLARIAHMGYDGVELAVRDPGLLDLPELEKLLAEYNLPVPAIGTGQAFREEGLSFTHPDTEVRNKAIRRIQDHMELAEKLHAVVIIGLIRGGISGNAEPDRAMKWLEEALIQCATTHRNVQLAIEPINRYETDLLNSVEQSLQFLEELHMENIGLLLDTFHMNIEEPSITESIKMSGKKLFHFHVADSNRCYPGAGHIDFSAVIQALKDFGYRRFISGEMLPLPDAETSARKMIEFFHQLK